VSDRLQSYRAKRDFAATPEPAPGPVAEAPRRASSQGLAFVVQKHAASRLHYDFRLEWGGVLLSWAVPKGPSLDPADKRMAIRTEDHPLSYGDFEGVIPQGHYGAGRVEIWDRGNWIPQGDVDAALAAGKLAFELHGRRLQGGFELIRTHRPGHRQEAWLLFKRRRDGASPLPPSAPIAPAHLLPERLPERLLPQLAVLATSVPPGGHWIFEHKFDGYRLCVRMEGTRVQLFTRGGHDWTDRMPALARALAALGPQEAWIDGELLAPGAVGGFGALQQALTHTPTKAVEFVAFDLPWFGGHDLRMQPLAARRALLRAWLQARPQPELRFSEALGEGGGEQAAALLQAAAAAQREGIVAKRADAPYRSTRDASWLKLKARRQQEFVIAGFSLRADDESAVGSLMLAVRDADGGWRSAGRVGTGWTLAAAKSLRSRLAALVVGKPLFAVAKGGRCGAPVQWVDPVLVAEVRFAERTTDGRVRHASFVAVREDKPSGEVVRERPSRRAAARSGLTHPDRVIDAESGLTKGQFAAYLEAAAPLLLRALRGRPVALLRAPGGVSGPLFFQKHPAHAAMPGVQALDPVLWLRHEALLSLPGVDALRSAAQMNVIEIHPWNALASDLMHPDRMVFDLDPGEGVDWPAVRDAALLTRSLLNELKLKAWLKTSGGRGLHLVVPIAPQHSFATVKAFSKAVVQHLAQVIPQRFVAVSGPSRRIGRIFVDYLRNGEGATTVGAYSPRARPGLGVSMPIEWEQLEATTGGAHWTVVDAGDWIERRKRDPWAGIWRSRQSLDRAMGVLGFKGLEPV